MCAHRLAPVSAFAPVGVGLVDSVEVGDQADFARAHLCDHGTYRSMRSCVYFGYVLSRPGPESEEVSAVLGLCLGQFPFASHCQTDRGFCCCHNVSSDSGSGYGSGVVCAFGPRLEIR